MGVCPGYFPLNFCSFFRCLTASVVVLGSACLVLPVSVRAALVINEVLADPAGSDGGHEFVELINNGVVPVSLESVVLQFANGAVAAEWVTRWAGNANITLAAGDRFLLVDRNWQGAVVGDAEAYLGLQNGPDAIRLLRQGEVLDLVGYGPLTDSELFEAQPVPVVPGSSLARRPDGRDTQNNLDDFVAALPTPGAPNFRPYCLAVTNLVLDPPVVARPGEALRVSFTLRNDGTENLPAGPCRLVWPGGEVSSWWDGATPDQELTLVFNPRLGSRGVVPLTWRYIVVTTGDTLQYEIGQLQVGPAGLRLNELLAAPGQGQGEWIEMQWTGPGQMDLAGYRLRDEDGSWSALPAVPLYAGDFVVVAEDSVELGLWMLANSAAGGIRCGDSHTVMAHSLVGSWPALNNSPPENRRYADRVYLADPSGVIIDAVAWGGPTDASPDRGVSLERLAAEPINPGAANWTGSTAQAGATPGCLNSVTAVAGQPTSQAGLIVVPPVLDRVAGPTVVHLRFILLRDEVSWEVRLFNLWGDQVRDFGGDARGPGPRDLIWDGTRDDGRVEPSGAYLAWLETRSDSGLIRRREKFRLVVR